jgi:hypothetical protein
VLIAPRLRSYRPALLSRSAFRFQHGVQRLLDGLPQDPTQVIPRPLMVNPDHIATTAQSYERSSMVITRSARCRCLPRYASS